MVFEKRQKLLDSVTDLSERTMRRECEGCGESTENGPGDLRLVVVIKPSFAPFFMCIECLDDEIVEESKMTVHF